MAVVHGFYDRQRLHPDPLFPHKAAAVLKAFFNDDPDSRHRSAGLSRNVQQACGGFAVCQEIIDNKDSVGRIYESFGNPDDV